MEASFRSRIDMTFGVLKVVENGSDTHLWSVEERAASKKNMGLSRGAEEAGSDDDEADFLKYESVKRRNNQGERLNSSFFGEEDLDELESGDENDDDEEDEDVEEERRIVKRKGGGGDSQTEAEVDNRANEGGDKAPPEPLGPLEEEDDEDAEVREVREMMGLDDTLDFEDEEDENDRLAVGTEGSDDRLFMSQIRNFGSSRQQLNPLPTSFIEMRQASHRDRRANHKAALARLQEDDREAATRAATKESETGKSDTAEDLNIGANPLIRHDNEVEAMDINSDGHHKEDAYPIAEARDEALGQVAGNLQSCRVGDIKQKKPGKRVRFAMDETAEVESKTGRSAEQEPLIIASTCAFAEDSTPSSADVQSTVTRSNRYSKVPDYVKNPAKYIHYTLDWSHEDEEQANVAAFQAARAMSSSTQNMVTDKQEDQLVESSDGPSESIKISFNPLVTKRSSKALDRGVVGKDSREIGFPLNGVVNVAANFDMDSNLGLIIMEDDQALSTSSDLTGQGKFGRAIRRYRIRATDDMETD